MSPLISCPKCQTRLMDGSINLSGLSPCPACGAELQVEAYPALFRKFTPVQSAQPVMVEGESSCFFHPQKKAVVPCGGCGRFLCALCDCEFHGEHYCPACLEAGKSKGKIKNLDNNRVRYDNIALSLAVLPVVLLFTVYFTFITAPMALFIVIRYWSSPRGLVQRSRFRFVIAGIFALLQIAGWTAVIIAIYTRHNL